MKFDGQTKTKTDIARGGNATLLVLESILIEVRSIRVERVDCRHSIIQESRRIFKIMHSKANIGNHNASRPALLVERRLKVEDGCKFDELKRESFNKICFYDVLIAFFIYQLVFLAYCRI